MSTAGVCGTVLIVGAGQAGGRTAQALRREGWSGPITLIGDEDEPPYERPPLSKDFLRDGAKPEALQLLDSPAWASLGISLRCGTRASAIDREGQSLLLSDGSRLRYDVLVLATGARARPFPGPVAPGTALSSLRTIADAQRLRPLLAPGRHIALIGAGFIGLELAATARQLGAQVTVIEAAARPLARLLPTDFAAWLAALHLSNGVALKLACPVSGLAPGRVVLQDGERIAADAIVVGIGAIPNDELAAAAGLAVRDGIIVDGAGRTSDPHILAAGDVARRVDAAAGIDTRLESWRNAEDQAQALASGLCGKTLPQQRPPWFWTDQYGHNIQIAGQPADGLHVERRGAAGAGPHIACYLDAGARLRGVIGVDCAREVRMAQALIQGGKAVDASGLPAPRQRVPA